jgi:hypothetical protein
MYEIRDIIGRYYFEVLIGILPTDNNQSAQRREKKTKASTMAPTSDVQFVFVKGFIEQH